VHGNGHAPFWNSGRRSDPPLDCNHPIQIALTLGADDGLVPDLQPGADRLKVGRRIGPATVGDEIRGRAVAETGGVEDHQRHPGGFGGRDHPGQHGPRIPFEDDEAPPPHALQRKVHATPVNKPVLTVRGFVRVRPRGGLHPWCGHVRNVVIHELIERHDAADRALRDVRPGQQAPDPELPGIRVSLLQVIDLHHERQPDLADRGVGCSTLVHQAGKGLGLEPPDPDIDRGPGHL
jgi:hypothetical protein